MSFQGRRPHTHPVRQRARASRGAYCAPLGSKWLARNPAGFEQVEKRLYVRGSRLLALVAGRKTGHAGHPHARDCCGEDLRLGARERPAAPSRNLTTLWLCSPQGCSMNLAHCCIRCRRVARYMGDGVLIYFGYPQAHEDDAERAVRAGLDCIDAVHHLDVRSVKLQARVGIATGLVIVGGLIGEDSAQEHDVVGETPNLAARLQSLAEPDTVAIAAGTRRLVGDLFEYRELGAVVVKGFARPVPAW